MYFPSPRSMALRIGQLVNLLIDFMGRGGGFQEGCPQDFLDVLNPQPLSKSELLKTHNSVYRVSPPLLCESSLRPLEAEDAVQSLIIMKH